MGIERWGELRQVGRGANGVVFRARSPSGEDVAIKLLTRGTPEALARFDREVRLGKELGAKEGFVPFLESGTCQDGPYLVMPFVPRGTLRMRLLRGPLSIEDVKTLARKLAAAIARAHRAGIVHRDLKPENVLFGAEDEPLIADLGLAKHFVRGDEASRSLTVTMQGAFAGTPGYMPPEQMACAATAGPAADVFALGAIIYECLTGKPAFSGQSVFELIDQVKSGDHVPLAAARAGTPPWLVSIVERALSLDPGARFADGRALVRALEEGEATEGRENALAVTVGLVLGLCAVIGVIAVLALHLQKAPVVAPSPIVESPSPRESSPSPAPPLSEPSPSPLPSPVPSPTLSREPDLVVMPELILPSPVATPAAVETPATLPPPRPGSPADLLRVAALLLAGRGRAPFAATMDELDPSLSSFFTLLEREGLENPLSPLPVTRHDNLSAQLAVRCPRGKAPLSFKDETVFSDVIEGGSAQQCLVVAREAVRFSFVRDSIILCLGHVHADGLDNSLVVCAGNITVGSLFSQSIVLAGGRLDQGNGFSVPARRRSLVGAERVILGPKTDVQVVTAESLRVPRWKEVNPLKTLGLEIVEKIGDSQSSAIAVRANGGSQVTIIREGQGLAGWRYFGLQETSGTLALFQPPGVDRLVSCFTTAPLATVERAQVRIQPFKDTRLPARDTSFSFEELATFVERSVASKKHDDLAAEVRSRVASLETALNKKWWHFPPQEKTLITGTFVDGRDLVDALVVAPVVRAHSIRRCVVVAGNLDSDVEVIDSIVVSSGHVTAAQTVSCCIVARGAVFCGNMHGTLVASGTKADFANRGSSVFFAPGRESTASLKLDLRPPATPPFEKVSFVDDLGSIASSAVVLKVEATGKELVIREGQSLAELDGWSFAGILSANRSPRVALLEKEGQITGVTIPSR